MFCLLLLLGCGGSEPNDPSTEEASPTGDTSAPGTTGATGSAPTDTAATAATAATAHTGDTGPTCLDPYDPNDTVDQAVPLVHGVPLRVSADDPDWWTLTLAPGEGATLSTDALEVEFETTDPLGDRVRYARTVLSYGNSSDTPKTLHLRTIGPSDACIDHVVRREDTTVPRCAEPDAVGDTSGTAQPLGIDPYYGEAAWARDLLGTGDVDWYRFPLEGGTTPTIMIYGPDDGMKVDLYRDPSQPP